MALGRFGAFLRRRLVRDLRYASSARLCRFTRRTAQKRPLRVAPPETHYLQRGTAAHFACCALPEGSAVRCCFLHGIGVSSQMFTTDTIDTNLVEYTSRARLRCVAARLPQQHCAPKRCARRDLRRHRPLGLAGCHRQAARAKRCSVGRYHRPLPRRNRDADGAAVRGRPGGVRSLILSGSAAVCVPTGAEASRRPAPARSVGQSCWLISV